MPTLSIPRPKPPTRNEPVKCSSNVCTIVCGVRRWPLPDFASVLAAHFTTPYLSPFFTGVVLFFDGVVIL